MALEMIGKDPASRIIRNHLLKGVQRVSDNAALRFGLFELILCDSQLTTDHRVFDSTGELSIQSLVVVAILFSSFKRSPRVSHQYFQSFRNHFFALNYQTPLCLSNNRTVPRLRIQIEKPRPVWIWKYCLHGILSYLPAMQVSF